MKCILIKDGKGPADNLYLGEEAVPKVKDGEVLVKVSFTILLFVAGINPKATMTDKSFTPANCGIDQSFWSKPYGLTSERREIPSSACS
jgi:hypothetical protein